jgi:hypothetical protein
MEIVDPIVKASEDAFHATRGRAIEAYAVLEQCLCNLFACFGGINENIAGIVFFKITSSRVRDAIMDKLLRKKHGTTYALFWNSMIKQIDKISRRRNEIVHWKTVLHFAQRPEECFFTLNPPNFWGYDANTEEYTASRLQDFIAECEFVSRLCSFFHMFLTHDVSSMWKPDQVQTWHDIFQRASVYPPPNTHPLTQSSSILGNLPPTSPESPP